MESKSNQYFVRIDKKQQQVTQKNLLWNNQINKEKYVKYNGYYKYKSTQEVLETSIV